MTAPVGTTRVTWIFSGANGATCNVVWHMWHVSGAEPTSAELITMLTSLKNWFTTDNYGASTNLAMYKHLSIQTNCSEVRAQTLDSTPTLASVTVGQAGVNTGPSAPNESAIVTTWRTATAGRSFRGRSFWPGYDPDMLDTTGLVSSSQITSWAATMNAMIATWNPAGNFQFSVYSPKLGLVTPITGVTVQPIVHHQRRRNH